MSSGTYSFQPSLGETVLYSFGLCGVKRTEILQQHMADARMAANLWLSEKANDQPNLFAVDLQTINLTQGTSSYALPPETVLLLDAYLRTGDGTTSQTDTYLLPISRTEFASFPDKITQGRPTVFWFDRTISPSVTVWQPPDQNGPYQFGYYRVRQMQDAVIPGGVTMDLPYRFFAAFAFGLAEYLAWSYAPDRVSNLAAKASQLWTNASSNDVEDAGMYIAPMLSTYYRRR